ncbi:MAG: hypothetical protein HY744_19355 [Deltaproteobacteria bacterium]|nr:hypothetical protein [Deltaproteobacteria bacterium]
MESSEVESSPSQSPAWFQGPAVARDPRATRILAKTIFKELRTGGLSSRQVLSIATELIGLVTEEMRQED